MMAELALLGVFAHPDDEQLMSGVFAQAASEGIRTGLICATRGELGEIASPELATPENLGQVRENELRAASAVLGIKYLWFLDYRDSGMMGTEGNDDPASFHRVDEAEATGKMVKIIRDFQADGRGYVRSRPAATATPTISKFIRLPPPPSMLQANPEMYPEAGEAWQPARLFYSGFPRGEMKRFGEMLNEMGVENFMGMADRSKFGLDDATISNQVNVGDWVSVKEKSLMHHRTQHNPDNLFSKMPKEWMDNFRRYRVFRPGRGHSIARHRRGSHRFIRRIR